MSEMKSIIAVVDDHPIVTEGVRSLLEENKAGKQIISFTKGNDLLSYLQQNIIDIIFWILFCRIWMVWICVKKSRK